MLLHSLNPIATSSVLQPPLKSIQILMIICAIMFLTLLLLGLAVSYYCLRSRSIPVVRRLPMSMGSGSEITKLSGSSVGNISAFEGVKIPRAHAALQAVYSSSGSEGALIPSDYPSESHSEIEEIDTRSLPFSSAGSFENRAFVHETSSIYSDHYAPAQEMPSANAVMTTTSVTRHSIPIQEAVAAVDSPKFDVQVRVKKSPPPPPSPVTSDTESVATLRPDRNNLSTIMEAYEDRESVLTMDSCRRRWRRCTRSSPMFPNSIRHRKCRSLFPSRRRLSSSPSSRCTHEPITRWWMVAQRPGPITPTARRPVRSRTCPPRHLT